MLNDLSLSPDSSTLGSIFAPLLAAAPLNELGAGRPDNKASAALRNLSLAEAFAPRRIADRKMADACQAGLWLMYDHLDESHTISQSIDTPTGSYWHAIMHRREGDFSNAKYWFDRVGVHPIFASLAEAARELAKVESSAAAADRDAAWLAKTADWDAFRFVDLCAAVVGGRSTAERLCRLIQQRECRLLFDFCYRQAIQLS